MVSIPQLDRISGGKKNIKNSMYTPTSLCKDRNLLCVLLLRRFDFPNTEILDIYISSLIPSESGNWSSPSYYLVRLASTYLSLIPKSTSVCELIYLYPISNIIWIKPDLLFYCYGTILFNIIHNRLIS